MPKMKTNSSVKKRFARTGSGKLRVTQSGKRHGMVKRTNKQIRNQRGTTILGNSIARLIINLMPYNKRKSKTD